MSVHLFTVGFQAVSLIPADTMVNTWHFEGSGSDAANVADMLEDFYTATPTGAAGPITGLMSSRAYTGLVTIKGYDLADPEPRLPMYEDTRSFTGLTNSEELPAEVSLVMSYHAQAVSGVNPGRRRGRVYLGGFITTATSGGRPASTLRDIVIRAGRDLIQASNASSSWEWQQYSPTNGTGNIVTGGWVDNAWDTQRRRGLASTARQQFTGGIPAPA